MCSGVIHGAVICGGRWGGGTPPGLLTGHVDAAIKAARARSRGPTSFRSRTPDTTEAAAPQFNVNAGRPSAPITGTAAVV